MGHKDKVSTYVFFHLHLTVYDKSSLWMYFSAPWGRLLQIQQLPLGLWYRQVKTDILVDGW